MSHHKQPSLWRRLRPRSYAILAAIFAFGIWLIISGKPPQEAEPPVVNEVAALAVSENEVVPAVEDNIETARESQPQVEWREGSFKGKPFFNQLLDNGLAGHQIQNLINALTPVYNFRKAKPTHRWQLALQDGVPESFTLEVSPTEIYDVSKLSEKPILEKRAIETFTLEEVIRGEIRGSLFQSLGHVEKPMRLGLKLADVFAWDIDFNRDPQNGDKFEILVETEYIKGAEGPVFHGYGAILAARYQSARRTNHATLFQPKKGKKGYFNAAGQSLIRDVLRSPLKVQIVTSRFNKNRFHPVLKRRRPHNGVDYGAKRGTPVMAVADGKVHRAGRYGGAGIAVELKHKKSMLTQYFHLSRIAKGVKRGRHVRQGQVIGYVGKTGYATGYHLHFGMKINGKYVDPQRQKFQPGVPIKKSEMKRFRSTMAAFMARLEPQPQDLQVLGLAPDFMDKFAPKTGPFSAP